MLGFLGDLLGLNAGEGTRTAATNNSIEMYRYDERGNRIIDEGAAGARRNLERVAGLYDPIAGSTAMVGDALGLNGSGGSDRATEAFRTNPGYEFQRDQGIQAIDRSQAARGSFQSGGAMADVMGYSQGLADQSYGGWLDRLTRQSDTALAGQTGAYNNLANLETGTASQRLGVAGDFTSGLLNANNLYAQGEEAGKAGIAGLGSNLLGMAGKAFGWGGF
jgi:hypothetical protein